jgi:hypothetical protein
MFLAPILGTGCDVQHTDILSWPESCRIGTKDHNRQSIVRRTDVALQDPGKHIQQEEN